MARSNKSKSGERIGKGKVTPVQVAYLVDQYLCDNLFLETRSIFRSEASSLISKSPLRQAPCSLIPLDDILNEYISLKEHKVIVDQENARLDQEKTRVQNLLHGMQHVMNAYNSTSSPPPHPAAIQVVASTCQPSNMGVSPSGGTTYNTPNLMAASLPGNKRVGNFTAPSSTSSLSITKKRKSPPEVSLGSAPSKERRKIPRGANYLTSQTSPGTEEIPMNNNTAANESSSPITSSVAKCLFTRSHISPPSNSASLKTPQKQVSPQSDVSITPTSVTKEITTVSPHKQFSSYTMERNHMVSSFSPINSNANMSSKRDHVKGRLNFDDTDTPPASSDFVSTSSSGSSEPQVDLFDIDFLSENFPFSEVLVDFDIACQGMPDPRLPQPSNCYIETASGSCQSILQQLQKRFKEKTSPHKDPTP